MSHIWRDPGRTWFAILARRSHLRDGIDCRTQYSSATRPVRHRTLACSSRPRRSVSAPDRHHHRVQESSWFACPNSPDLFMLAGLSELGQAYLSILNVYSLPMGSGGAARHYRGLSSRIVSDALHRAAETLTIKMAANDAILFLICSYVEPCMAARAPRSCSTSPAPPPMRHRAPMVRAGVARRNRPGHRHCDIGRNSAARCSALLCLAAFTPLLAEVSALIRGIRVLLAGAARW